MRPQTQLAPADSLLPVPPVREHKGNSCCWPTCRCCCTTTSTTMTTTTTSTSRLPPPPSSSLLRQVSLLTLTPSAPGTLPGWVLGCVTQRADLWLNIFLDATPASWLSWIWKIIAWRSCLLFQAIWSPWRSSLCSASKLQWRHLRR